MFWARHFRATKILRDFPDARVVRGDNYFRKRFCLLALLNDVLDERLASDRRERLAGKPRRAKTRGDDANDYHAASLAEIQMRMKHRIMGITPHRLPDRFVIGLRPCKI
jgi:hypothetical protein